MSRQTAGMAAGAGGCVMLGTLAWYTILILTRVEKAMVLSSGSLMGAPVTRLNFPQLVARVFPLGLGSVNVHQLFVFTNIILSSLGAVIAYGIFIIETLPLVIKDLPSVRACIYVAVV